MPEEFTGIVFDIGRGQYDHHQKDSRIRENGIPYAAFGLLWETLGKEILGEELAKRLMRILYSRWTTMTIPMRKELASLIGNFNPGWDSRENQDEAFFQAVSVAGMILEK